MNIENFLEKLEIACAPDNDQNKTTDDTSISYAAIQEICKDKESIFIIIHILENDQNFSAKIIFLTKSILNQLINKIDISIYDNMLLDQFSEAFFHFINKYKDSASIFSQGIIAFAKSPVYESKFVILVEKIAFEVLDTPDKELNDYNFAASTLSSLISYYSKKISDKKIIMDFCDKLKSATLPYFDPEFPEYKIPATIISIYTCLEVYIFEAFEDLSILQTFLNVLSNVENFQITDSFFPFFDKLLNFFIEFIMHCKGNADNRELRCKIIEELSDYLLQILPKFCFFLINLLDKEPNTRFLAGRSFTIMKFFFDKFEKSESYDSEFDGVLKSIISFAQLSDDDFSDFDDNIFNYYNTAFEIEENSRSNARSNSVLLLRLMCQNKDQKYINRTIEVLVQLDLKEENYFLISNIVDLIKDEPTKEIVHQYIISVFDSYQDLSKPIHFSFVNLAANSIPFLTNDESEKMLQLADMYIDELNIEDMKPSQCFIFTIASKIIENFVKKYKDLPPELIIKFMELSGCSFSLSTTKLVDSIFDINPELFETYQNSVIEQSISIIRDIILESNVIFLEQRQYDSISTNIESLIYQTEHPSPNFPGQIIVSCIDDCSVKDTFTSFFSDFSILLSNIIKSKLNGYENAIELAVKLFDKGELMNYHTDIVIPILNFILYDMDSELYLKLLQITLKNIDTHLKTYPPITDDDELPDLIACTTLASRIIQSLNSSLLTSVYDSIIQIITDIRNERNDLASNFIIFEILASLTLINNGAGMNNEIDFWISLCSSGIIQTDYYRLLHFFALKFISETFPDRSADILPVIEILSQNNKDSIGNEAELFMKKYYYLYSFAQYKAPFQKCLSE